MKPHILILSLLSFCFAIWFVDHKKKFIKGRYFCQVVVSIETETKAEWSKWEWRSSLLLKKIHTERRSILKCSNCERWENHRLISWWCNKATMIKATHTTLFHLWQILRDTWLINGQFWFTQHHNTMNLFCFLTQSSLIQSFSVSLLY